MGMLELIAQKREIEDRKDQRNQDLALTMLQLEMASERHGEDQEYKTTQVFLEHNLNKLERLNAHLATLKNESTKLGLVGDKLTNQDGGASKGSRDIYNTSAGTLDTEIKSVQGEILDEETDQAHYYAGLNYARNMDEDISGSISDNEYNEFMKDTTQYPNELKGSAPFYYGVQNYTLSPDKILALTAARTEDQLKQLAIKMEQVKHDYLPKSLKQDEELKQMTLDTGGVQLSILEEQKKQAKFATQVAESEVSLITLRHDSAQLEFNKAQYEWDGKMREDHIQSIDEMLINNIQAQSGIGAGILANMSLELKNNVSTPMFSVLAGTVEQDYLGQIGKASNLEYIAEDVQKLYSAYGLGKSEDQVPDYSFVLNQVEELVELKTLHSDFLKEFDDELTIEAGRMKRSKYSMEVLQRVASKQPIERYSLKKLFKAIQWHNTGIYDDMKLLDQAVKANMQYQQVSAMQEKARGLDITYNTQQFGTYQQTAVETNIPFTTRTDYIAPWQAPQDTTTTDMDNVILEIFNQNVIIPK